MNTAEARQKIQTTKLIQRLDKCAMGKLELRSDQLESIKTLLRKALPDLAAIQHSGDADNPVAVTFTWLKDG